MKCTLSPQQLGAGLAAVTRAVSSRNTLPILSNVLVEAREGALDLTATNLDLTIHHTMAAEVEQPGIVTVPARILSEFVSSLPEQPLTWNLDAVHQTVRLQSGRFDAHVRGIDAAEFPPLPEVGDGDSLELDPQVLLRGIDQTVIAASGDEGRPIYTGVLVEFDGPEVTMVATDGHRLAVRVIRLTEGSPEPHEKFGIIVPARALVELSRLLKPLVSGPASVTLSVAASRSQVRFQLPGYELITRLIDGVYPGYEKVIPSGAQTTVTVSTEELRRTTRVVSLFARDAANVLKLRCEPGQLVLSANTNEVGDNVASLDATVDGDSLGIAFNAKYVSDVLSLLDSPEAELILNGPLAPGLIRAPGDDSYRYVIMPVRVAL
ncbi:MAG TPA: DNA polymerase III subunit beta [Candidatus Nanopelagicaceae bacterium]|nr:DNA polymerase III subunit beta [Candidatus Nanopelagicaceae bacterium]